MGNKIRVNIGGINYVVTSDDNEEYVRKIGDELNHRIAVMSKENPYLSTTMVAVLSALEYCDAAKRSEIECEDLKTKLKSMTEEIACSRVEIDGARREIERLNRENRQLRMENNSI